MRSYKKMHGADLNEYDIFKKTNWHKLTHVYKILHGDDFWQKWQFQLHETIQWAFMYGYKSLNATLTEP